MAEKVADVANTTAAGTATQTAFDTSTSTLAEILSGAQQSNIAPFLWVHGESEEAYREEIRAIHAAGMDQLCIEARPHEDFGGPGWFADIAIILDECKRLGMGAWLLDDSHFPTGFANGEVQKNHPDLRKQYLSLKTFDVMGPLDGAELNLKYALAPESRVLAIVAQRRQPDDTPDPASSIDLTAAQFSRVDYNTGKPADMMGHPLGFDWGECPMVRLDLPEGQWYVQVLQVGYSGGEKETEGYLNPLRAEATQVLVDTVYQPMWDHFAEDFGTTFLGFFSDEPRFGNIHGAEGASIGRNPQMPLPWRDDLLELLAARLAGTTLGGPSAGELTAHLPLLFVGESDEAHVLRYAYMDLVSDLYAENFDGVLSAWCAEHGVRKIGHTIEDENAIARLGYGAGHFFRAMRHSSMAGIDVVLHQLTPGYDSGLFRALHKPGWDAEFYTYMLGKLGGSLAHLDPSKGGRCMAEVFGAYGWATGNRLCKWIADYMLVRGVNFLVPHAFDAMDFPDPDCPAQFYAQGHNPQYPEFRQVMDYANRLCSLLSGGRYDAPVALWFNAEGEWSGEWQLTQKPAAELARAQVEYDLVSSDYLDAATLAEDGRAQIGAERFRAVVLPWSEAIPAGTASALVRLAEGGIPVFVCEALPVRLAEGEDDGTLARLTKLVRVVPTDALAGAVVEAGLRELAPHTPQRWLRTYHYQTSEGLDAYLLVNEHPQERINCTLSGAALGHTYVYDAFANTLVADDNAFALDLPPYGSKVVLVSAEPLDVELLSDASVPTFFDASEAIELGTCTLELADFEGRCRSWSEPLALDAPTPVSTLPGRAGFAGRARYGFELSLTDEQVAAAARGAILEVAGVAEAAIVTVNGTDCGTRVVPDYRFMVGQALHAGTNTITIEVNTTLGRPMGDFISQMIPNPPTGISAACLLLSR